MPISFPSCSPWLAATLLASCLLGPPTPAQQTSADQDYPFEGSLFPPDGFGGARFGQALDLSEGRLVVGAPADGLLGAGSVLVFDDPTPGAEPSAVLSAFGGMGSLFGRAVDLDGSRLAVGSPSDGPRSEGAVYLFRHDGSAWQEEFMIESPDGAMGDRFGFAVSLEGGRLLVGAPLHDGFRRDGGAAYVFEAEGSSWVWTAKLEAAALSSRDFAASSVALMGDEAFVGVPHDDVQGSSSGSVVQWMLVDELWVEGATLLAAEGSARDLFGDRLVRDGSRLLVGAPGSAAASNEDEPGSAHLFEPDGGAWVEVQRFESAFPRDDGQFGSALALVEDRVVIGAPGEADGRGAAHVFEFVDGAWSSAIALDGSSASAGDRLGSAAAIGAGSLFVGAERSDAAATDAGEVLVHELPVEPEGPVLSATPSALQVGDRLTLALEGGAPRARLLIFLVDGERVLRLLSCGRLDDEGRWSRTTRPLRRLSRGDVQLRGLLFTRRPFAMEWSNIVDIHIEGRTARRGGGLGLLRR